MDITKVQNATFHTPETKRPPSAQRFETNIPVFHRNYTFFHGFPGIVTFTDLNGLLSFALI